MVFIIRGIMIDGHMHMVLDGVYWKEAIRRHEQRVDIEWIRRTLALYQARGFIWLRDGGDRWGVGAAARALAPEYGITYRTPLSPLHWKGHYGRIVGTPFESMREYAILVQKLRRAGADFIKIMISGLMDMNQYGVLTEQGLPPEMLGEMIHIAHEEGFAVMAHANGARTVEAAAVAGVDSVEHGAYLDEDALAAMAENGSIWVPTVSTLAGPIGKGRFPDEVLRRILDSALENVAAFRGLVAPGSDAGAWAVPHGETMEYQLLSSLTDLEKGTAALMERFS